MREYGTLHLPTYTPKVPMTKICKMMAQTHPWPDTCVIATIGQKKVGNVRQGPNKASQAPPQHTDAATLRENPLHPEGPSDHYLRLLVPKQNIP